MQLTKNFHMVEFDCRDGSKVPYQYVPNVTRLADCLQTIRDHIGTPIHITSAYRSPAHNSAVGGAEKSQHLIGKAADLVSNSLTPRQLYDIIEHLIKNGKIREGGLGLYNSFVHYDIRDGKARW